MSCHSIGSCKRKLVNPARHWRAGHQRPCEFRSVGELSRFVWSWEPSESSCALSHGSDDRRHRHPATDGQHGQPAGDRGPHHGAGLLSGAPTGARAWGASSAGEAAGGAGCDQPRWGDLKRLVPCPALGPCWLFPRRMGRWRNLGGAGGPSTPCPLHSPHARCSLLGELRPAPWPRPCFLRLRSERSKTQKEARP